MEKVTLTLSVTPNGSIDKDDLVKTTNSLQKHLLNLKTVDEIDLARSMTQSIGTKSGEEIAWGTLLITLAASGGVLTTLISSIISWLRRNDVRSVTLEINGNKLEVTGLSAKEQQELIDVWLSRNSGIIK